MRPPRLRCRGRPSPAALPPAAEPPLRLPAAQFVYLRSAVTPALDDGVRELFETFGEDGKLIVYYSLQPAWG